jgi:general secretion pathway protein G
MKAVRKTFRAARSRRSGFSLLELLIVLAIIGVIAAMVVPQLLGRQKQAYIDITEESIHNLEQALKLYAVDHDAEFPQGSQESLQVLIEPMDRNNKPMAPYIEKLPMDAWGEPLYYQYPNDKSTSAVDKPAIWSAGPDRKNDNGSNDDINNWTVVES